MAEEIGVRREKHICEECLHWITEIRQKNLLEELRKWNPRLQGKWLWSVFLNDLCVSTITRDWSWRDLHLLQSSGFQTTPTLVRFPSPNIVNCNKTGFGTSSTFFVDFLSSLSLRLHNPRGHWFYFKEWWINVALQTCSNIWTVFCCNHSLLVAACFSSLLLQCLQCVLSPNKESPQDLNTYCQFS